MATTMWFPKRTSQRIVSRLLPHSKRWRSNSCQIKSSNCLVKAPLARSSRQPTEEKTSWSPSRSFAPCKSTGMPHESSSGSSLHSKRTIRTTGTGVSTFAIALTTEGTFVLLWTYWAKASLTSSRAINSFPFPIVRSRALPDSSLRASPVCVPFSFSFFFYFSPLDCPY